MGTIASGSSKSAAPNWGGTANNSPQRLHSRRPELLLLPGTSPRYQPARCRRLALLPAPSLCQGAPPAAVAYGQRYFQPAAQDRAHVPCSLLPHREWRVAEAHPLRVSCAHPALAKLACMHEPHAVCCWWRCKAVQQVHSKSFRVPAAPASLQLRPFTSCSTSVSTSLVRIGMSHAISAFGPI